jgi:hypothetical protein
MFQLHRIVIAPIPEILFLYATGQMEVDLIWYDQTSKTDFFIIHKIQELHTEIHSRGFILYHQFMGYMNFVQMNPQDFIQNSSKEPA